MITIELNGQTLGFDFRYGTETRMANQMVRHELEHDGHTWHRNAREEVEVELRTTTCKIYDIKDPKSKSNPVVASGTVFCDSRDRFEKEFGRRQSLVKALMAFYGVDVDHSAEILDQYFTNQEGTSDFFKKLNWVDNRISEALYKFDQYREAQREQAYLEFDIHRAHLLLEEDRTVSV